MNCLDSVDFRVPHLQSHSYCGQALSDCIRQFIASQHGNEGETARDVSESIARILFGTKKTRLGNAPTPQEMGTMAGRIQKWVEIGSPVEILTLWGAMKGYGQAEDRLDADIMDLIGLRRYADMQSQVAQVYEPGLCVKIVREDVGEIALSGSSDSLSARISPYQTSLDHLCEVCGFADHIRFVDESQVLANRGVSQTKFLQKGKANAEVLFHYWVASLNEPDTTQWENLPEYAALQALGWKGTIPAETREHYMNRVATEHPTMPTAEKISQVCTYLGNALARVQVGMFVGAYQDKDGKVIPPIRTSFVPYPPGTPATLRVARVDYKVKDSKTSSNSTPPWCGFGFLIPTRGASIIYEPKMVGLRDYRELNKSDIVPTTVHVVAPNGDYQPLRADIIAA
jgi:hypothetical protein